MLSSQRGLTGKTGTARSKTRNNKRDNMHDKRPGCGEQPCFDFNKG
jgi:hypothetical protein